MVDYEQMKRQAEEEQDKIELRSEIGRAHV